MPSPVNLTPQVLPPSDHRPVPHGSSRAHHLRRFLELQNGVRCAEVSDGNGEDTIDAVVAIADTPTGLGRNHLPDGRSVTELNPHETRYLYEEIFLDRVYAPSELTLPPRPLVLDVGANIGMFSLFMADFLEEPQILAFEPSPDAFTALAANAAEHNLPVVCLPWAMGAQDCQQAMTVYPTASVYSGMYADAAQDLDAIRAAIDAAVDDADSSEVVDDVAASRMEGVRTTSVAVVSLPTVLRRLGDAQVDLLKLDAEGAELDILQPHGGVDWRRIDRIIMEIHREADVPGLRALLEGVGYACVVQTIPALRGTGYTNLIAQRREITSSASPRRPAIGLESVAPPSPQERLQRAAEDFLGRGAGTVRLAVRRAADHPPSPAAGAADTPSALPAVTDIWRDLLGVEPQPTDDFFALGGTSLVAVRMLARVRRELTCTVDLGDFLADSVLTNFAARVTPK